MLRADHDRVDPHGPVAVVFDRDLALAVGPQPIDLALLPHARQPVENAVGQGDRQRHQLGRLVAGIAEHQALVAGPVAIDAHRDVRALAVQLHIDLAGLGVEADVVVRVADGRDHVAGDFLVIDLGRAS